MHYYGICLGIICQQKETQNQGKFITKDNYTPENECFRGVYYQSLVRLCVCQCVSTKYPGWGLKSHLMTAVVGAGNL